MPTDSTPTQHHDAISQRLERCYTGVVHDILRAMGLRDFTLPPELRPILPKCALAGPAFTISGKVQRDVDAHQTLLAWTGLLSKAPAGSIWTSQPNDRVVAHIAALRAAGVGPETPVGVHLPRSSQLVVSALAIWLAGSFQSIGPTIANNIAFGKPGTSEADIKRAAEIAIGEEAGEPPVPGDHARRPERPPRHRDDQPLLRWRHPSRRCPHRG